MSKRALALVYDESNRKILVMNEFGAIDITQFVRDASVNEHINGVSCEIQGSLIANYLPDCNE